MASLSLKNITKTYSGGFTAVTDFNLDIEDKEFIIFVGPSGCGKSTTLRMIAGLEEITEGELYIGDQLMNDVVPKDRDIAMVFQNYALYPHMTLLNKRFKRRLRFSASNTFSTESLRLCRAVRDSVLLWDVQLCVNLKYSLWTNLSLTLTQSSEFR